MTTKMSRKELEQNGVVFITYMIGASYFNVKPECSSSFMEKKLGLYYRELSEKKQQLLEKVCDEYMRKIIDSLPVDLWELRSVVDFEIRKSPEEGFTFEVTFETWEYVFSLKGKYENRRLEFSHDVWAYNRTKMAA